jgi:hypothetical protein
VYAEGADPKLCQKDGAGPLNMNLGLRAIDPLHVEFRDFLESVGIPSSGPLPGEDEL